MAETPFTTIEEELLVAAIRYAEHQTSGEVRVHIEPNCEVDPYTRAIKVFNELSMDKTAERNGVLVYLAFSDRKFAIVGDEGIHKKVGDQFWNHLKGEMQKQFVAGYIISGLVIAIMGVGQQLAAHFPYDKADKNELSDEISFA